MKLEVSGVAYENIVYELRGVAFLLECVAQTTESNVYDHTYHGLQLLNKIVAENAKKLDEMQGAPD